MPVTDSGMTCAYCGDRQEKVVFFIGAKLDTDAGWTMHEGTGKMSCNKPSCHMAGEEEAGLKINRITKGG